MRAIGNFIIRGQLEAVVVISFLSVISLLVPILAYPLSGTPVALITMRRGGKIAIQVMVGSFLVTTILTMLLTQHLFYSLAFALGIWLPVWCCSMVLRMTYSHGKMVMAAGAIGILCIALMYALLGDVSAWWKLLLDTWISNFSDLAGEGYEDVIVAIEKSVPWINAMMASGLVISLILTTLAGRWWQAMLFFPREFRKEFYALRLPRGLIYPTLVGVGISLLAIGGSYQPMVRDILVVLVFLYLFHGVSAIHKIVNLKEMSHTWLVGMYGLLFFLPQMVLFVAFIGMTDSWVGSNKIDSDKNIS